MLTRDVLIAASGQLLNAPEDLVKAMHVHLGDTLQLDFTRGGKQMTCVVHPLGGETTGVEAA